MVDDYELLVVSDEIEILVCKECFFRVLWILELNMRKYKEF